MDNLCHTLVGAAIGETGFRRRTPLASATLMIASNLPDVDVLVFATSVPSIAFRRGWTHGVLAQAVLPIALAAVMTAVGRRSKVKGQRAKVEGQGARVEGQRSDGRFSSYLLLSYIGVLLHVGMDLLNNYGVRLLMPFDNRWFYGDTLFIIDPWLWIALGLGVWLSRVRQTPKPARIAVAAAAVYVLAMVVNARVARGIVADAWTAEHGAPPAALMVGPMPITPFRKAIIVDAGEQYDTGEFQWLPTSVRFDNALVPKNDGDPRAQASRQSRNVQAFLVWSRFPTFRFAPAADGTEVSVADMRFNDRAAPGPIRNRFGATTRVSSPQSPQGN